MKAIPLSEMSVAACAKALAFTWISRFGVPETITSDRGPQFTSSLWFQLREMLNISPGVYISVRKRYLFPPPSENDIFSHSYDTMFFDSHCGLFALILPYFAIILPFTSPFLIFFPLSSFFLPLPPFSFSFLPFSFAFSPFFLFTFSYFSPK
jgi:hypothetical protein